MKFYATINTVSTEVVPCNPWEFVATENITEEIRKTKSARQDWYRNPKTKHCFYSGFEGRNPHCRISKENPPRLLWAIVADYDTIISDERMREAIALMKIKPTYIETSVGGNRRLIWILEIPILIEDDAFGVFVLQRAMKWLKVQQLPELDEPAFVAPSRTYCCGDKWEATGHGEVPKDVVQPFFIECGKAFRFRGDDGVVIPLDVVEAACKEKYPDTFSKWPGAFEVGAQGPSFWVPGSQSGMSAIVKPDGIFTYAGHATKPFSDWADILGKEFVKNYVNTSMTKATEDVWHDGKSYFRKIEGLYASVDKGALTTYFRVTCGLSSKPDKTGNNPVEQAFDHIHNHQRVKGAAPFVPLPSGPIIYNNRRHLNIYDCKALEPANTGSPEKWGPHGNFPWICMFIDDFYSSRIQFDYYLAWIKYAYTAAYNHVVLPGQTSIFMGEAGTGKTLLNRYINAALLGGFGDASNFLINNSQFNSNLIEKPYWALDDDTTNSNTASSNTTHAQIKKLVANISFEYHAKFEIPCMVDWGGRLGITANLDAMSAKIVGPLDNGTIGKINLFRCKTLLERAGFRFPTRPEIVAILAKELPHFAKYLLEMEYPKSVDLSDPRYHVGSYQEPTLLEQTEQSSPAAPFKELVFEAMTDWFRQNPEATEWRGSSNRVQQLLNSDIRNEQSVRAYRPEVVNRFLEQLQKEGLMTFETKLEGKQKIRNWIFTRPEGL